MSKEPLVGELRQKDRDIEVYDGKDWFTVAQDMSLKTFSLLQMQHLWAPEDRADWNKRLWGSIQEWEKYHE